MEQDNQQFCSSTVPVISRLDRLDRLLQQLEKKQNLLSQKPPSSIPTEGEPDEQCKSLSSVLDEVHSKGTLVERLAMLEKRVLQLSLAMEEGNTSSSSTSTKPDTENSKQTLPAEQDAELINCLEKDGHVIIQETGSQKSRKSDTCGHKESRRHKKKTHFFNNKDKRRFGWFQMGC